MTNQLVSWKIPERSGSHLTQFWFLKGDFRRIHLCHSRNPGIFKHFCFGHCCTVFQWQWELHMSLWPLLNQGHDTVELCIIVMSAILCKSSRVEICILIADCRLALMNTGFFSQGCLVVSSGLPARSGLQAFKQLCNMAINISIRDLLSGSGSCILSNLPWQTAEFSKLMSWGHCKFCKEN